MGTGSPQAGGQSSEDTSRGTDTQYAARRTCGLRAVTFCREAQALVKKKGAETHCPLAGTVGEAELQRPGGLGSWVRGQALQNGGGAAVG